MFTNLFTLEAVENPNKYLQRGYISTFFIKNDFGKKEKEEIRGMATSMKSVQSENSDVKSVIIEEGINFYFFHYIMNIFI